MHERGFIRGQEDRRTDNLLDTAHSLRGGGLGRFFSSNDALGHECVVALGTDVPWSQAVHAGGIHRATNVEHKRQRPAPDAEAARVAAGAGIGAEVTMRMGHKLTPHGRVRRVPPALGNDA